jgi:polyisoprenoid-binding protein YceI
MNVREKNTAEVVHTRKTAISIAAQLLLAQLLLISHLAWSQKKLPFESSPVRFVVKNAGIKVGGTIEGIQGLLEVDPINENLIKIEGTVDPNTIETGISLRDNHLKKEEYFNVKKYPKLHIISTSFSKNGNGKYTGSFDLTMKGVKKSFSIPFTLVRVQDQYELKAEFTLNRLDFEIGDKSFILSDDVTVKIDLKTGTKMVQ